MKSQSVCRTRISDAARSELERLSVCPNGCVLKSTLVSVVTHARRTKVSKIVLHVGHGLWAAFSIDTESGAMADVEVVHTETV